MLKLVDPSYLAISICLLILLYLKHRAAPKLPDLPWVYRDDSKWFNKWRARIQASLNYRKAVHDAYNQYSRYSMPCILPSIVKDVIILPSESIGWLASQPNSVLNHVEAARDQLQFNHTWLLPQVAEHLSHHDTIRQDLTRKLGTLTADLIDELDSSFTDLWGVNTEEYKDVCVFETMLQTVARTSNRVFVGKPLCRNQKLLSAATGFPQSMLIAAGILRPLPSILRPLLAPIVSYVAHKREREFTKIVMAEITARQSRHITTDAKPNDFLQWTIDRAAASGIPFESEPRTMAARLLIVNFAAIHTSTLSITNAIFDLIASKKANVDILREDAQANLEATGGVWSKTTLQRMFKHDSALRESSRIGIFSSTGLNRKVTAPNGLETPEGTQLPSGSWVGIAANAVHYDINNYADPLEYKPFRFSDVRECQGDGKDGKAETRDDLIKKANLSFVTTSPTFQTFGHGIHACPGRFFAANELKLLLAYMVLNYDFEMLEERPPSKWMGDLQLPPMQATIRVRRRKAAEV